MDRTVLLVRVTDSHGRPVEGAGVKASLTMPAMDMGHNTVSAVPQGNGTYVGTGRFTMAGDWLVTVQAAKGALHTARPFPLRVR